MPLTSTKYTFVAPVTCSTALYQFTTTGTPVIMDEMKRNYFKKQRGVRIHKKLLQKQASLANIIPLVDTFNQDSRLYCVYPYYERGDLYSYTQERKVSLPEIQRFYMQIVHRVAFCHANKYAHRDLSLENFLLDADNNCILRGFAFATKAYKYSTDRVGKPFYMAPEVVTGQRYLPSEADMWSLGILLFVMFTGHPPFALANEQDRRFTMF